MILTIKRAALIIAVSAGISACDSAQIIGGPLEIGAALSNNLLDHGGFERGFGAWRLCSAPDTVTLKSNDTKTASSAVFGAGGCLSQIVPAQANDHMVVNCSALKSGLNWASITFGYLDEDKQPLKTVEAEIPTNSFTNVSATLRAPSNTAFAQVIVYTEEGGEIDDCVLINTQQGLPEELLINSHFEENLTGWQACSHGTVTVENTTATIDNSCLTQKFTASEGLALQLTCDGVKTGTEHAAIGLGFIDRDNQGIALREAVLSTEAGQNPTVALTAPESTAFAQTIIYTEGLVDLSSCSMKEISAEQAISDQAGFDNEAGF